MRIYHGSATIIRISIPMSGRISDIFKRRLDNFQNKQVPAGITNAIGPLVRNPRLAKT